MIRAALLAGFAMSLAAMEWTYDKQAHAAAGGLMGYCLADLAERTTDWRPFSRFLAATVTGSAIAYGYELCVGYRDDEDWIATTAGVGIGAGLQVGVSLILTPDRAALRLDVPL